LVLLTGDLLARKIKRLSNPDSWRAKVKVSDLKKYAMQFTYGHKEILLDYMGFDRSVYFKGVVQHGVGPTFLLHAEWPTPRIGILKRAPLLVYSESAAIGLKKLGVKDVTAIGSPWLYSKLMQQAANPQANSTEKFLVFPRHFTFGFHHNWTEQEIEKSLRGWLQIAQGHQLGVCLYWIDFLNPSWHVVLKRLGIAIHCAGISNTNPVDSESSLRIDFYPSLARIMNGYTHCIFQSFTSAMFYAADLGKEIGYFPDEFEAYQFSRNSGLSSEANWLFKNVPEIIGHLSKSENLLQITRDLLGVESLKSPMELNVVSRHSIKKILPTVSL